jgi:hypothetical protein
MISRATRKRTLDGTTVSSIVSLDEITDSVNARNLVVSKPEERSRRRRMIRRSSLEVARHRIVFRSVHPAEIREALESARRAT